MANYASLISQNTRGIVMKVCKSCGNGVSDNAINTTGCPYCGETEPVSSYAKEQMYKILYAIVILIIMVGSVIFIASSPFVRGY